MALMTQRGIGKQNSKSEILHRKTANSDVKERGIMETKIWKTQGNGELLLDQLLGRQKVVWKVL